MCSLRDGRRDRQSCLNKQSRPAARRGFSRLRVGQRRKRGRQRRHLQGSSCITPDHTSARPTPEAGIAVGCAAKYLTRSGRAGKTLSCRRPRREGGAGPGQSDGEAALFTLCAPQSSSLPWLHVLGAAVSKYGILQMFANIMCCERPPLSPPSSTVTLIPLEAWCHCSTCAGLSSVRRCSSVDGISALD